MKRSKMLQLMFDYYEDHYQECVTYDTFFDGLLELLENKGMLPPFHEPTYMKVWRDGGSGNVWEKEND